MQPYAPYDEDWVPEYFGLANISGKMCWMNALIQLLLSLPALNQTVLNFRGDPSNSAFTNEYISMILAARDGHKDVLAGCNGRLLKALQSHVAGVKRGVKSTTSDFIQQECADEGLVLILSAFGHTAIKNLFLSRYNVQMECGQCLAPTDIPKDSSLKIEVFASKPATTEADFCTYLRCKMEFVPDWKCPKCGQKSYQTLRIERLKALREIVILVFPKYYRKELAWFPARLRFNAIERGEFINYKLVGFIDHSGTQAGGHYVATVTRGNTNEWVRIDDHNTRVCGPEPTVNTYMAAYHML